MKVGLFYGTNTGVTEMVAERLVEIMNENGFEVDLHDIANESLDTMEDYNTLIIATPTWNDGELQDDWEEVIDEFNQFDFSGKKVGFVGTGDQEAYCDNYLDAIGVMAVPVRNSGGIIFGRWKNEGYSGAITSKGLEDDGFWTGLALDNDNQEELTEERLDIWVRQIKAELGVE